MRRPAAGAVGAGFGGGGGGGFGGAGVVMRGDRHGEGCCVEHWAGGDCGEAEGWKDVGWGGCLREGDCGGGEGWGGGFLGDRRDAKTFEACGRDGFGGAEGEFDGEGDSAAGWGGGFRTLLFGEGERAWFGADDVHVGAHFEDLVFEGFGAGLGVVLGSAAGADGAADGPGRGAGCLAAEGVLDAFCVANFGWDLGDGNEGLKDGVDEDPADFAGIGTAYGFFFFHRPYPLKADVILDEATASDFGVGRVGG